MATAQQKALALPIIVRASVAAERLTGCPAEVSVAQCALESDWLNKAPEHNCFGIKKAKRHARSQILQTHEVLKRENMLPGDVITRELPDGRVEILGPREFAAFDSLDDCFLDHAKLITGGDPNRPNVYAPAWKAYTKDHNMDRWVYALGPIYGSGEKYASALLKFAHQPDIALAVQQARAVTV